MDRLRQLFRGGGRSRGPADDPSGLYIYIRCNRCQEKIRVRVNRNNDLSERLSDDDSDRVDGYQVEKGIVGNNFLCGQTMRLFMTFDRSRLPKEERVEGGTIISEAEFNAP